MAAQPIGPNKSINQKYIDSCTNEFVKKRKKKEKKTPLVVMTQPA
jgi:hypothetical protein